MICDEIWVLAETRQGIITRSTWQLTGAARQLADQRDLGVAVVLIGGEQVHIAAGAQAGHALEAGIFAHIDEIPGGHGHGVEVFDSGARLG